MCTRPRKRGRETRGQNGRTQCHAEPKCRQRLWSWALGRKGKAEEQRGSSGRRGGVVEGELVDRVRVEARQDARRGELDERLLELGGREHAVNVGLGGVSTSKVAGDAAHQVERHGGDGHHARELRGERVLDGGDREVVRLAASEQLKVGGAVDREQIGEQADNVRAGHRGARDGVDRGVARVPGGEDVEAGRKDVDALALVGEVGALVLDGGGADGDGVGCAGGRDVAGILVLVACGDAKVHACGDGAVDGLVERGRLAAAERHVGDEALVLLGRGRARVGAELCGKLLGVVDGPEDTAGDVRHGSGAAGAEHLDGDEVRLLCYAVLARADGTGAVGAVTVAVLVDVVLGHGLAPASAALELDVVDVDAGVDDVGGDALTAVALVDVLVEGAEAEALAVRDAGETPGGTLLNVVGADLVRVHDRKGGLAEVGVVLNVPGLVLGLRHDLDGDARVHLDVLDLGLCANVIEDVIGELAGVALEVALEVVDVADAFRILAVEAVCRELGGRDEALVGKEVCGADAVLEDDHVGARDGLEIGVCGQGRKLSRGGVCVGARAGHEGLVSGSGERGEREAQSKGQEAEVSLCVHDWACEVCERER
ncbi:hypothetical protein L1887_47046 [Cichorium endivia]|nr:hypothetical protein L1887_47046 [Cichorium endivia]